jgi:hypothetical protein
VIWRPCGTQREPSFLGRQIAGAFGRVQNPASSVEGPAQIVGGSPFTKMWPELIHYLLAVEAVVWRERKKLDQGSGPPEPPLALPDGPRPYPDREAAEHPDPNGLWFLVYHRCLLLAAIIAMVVDLHYSPAKHDHQTESTSFSTVLGTPLPNRVASTGPS